MLDIKQFFSFSDINAQKEKTDMIIRSWKSEHEEEYSIFKERINNISHGDLSVLYDLFSLLEECLPSEEETQPLPFDIKPITEFRDEMWNDMPLSVKSYIVDIAKDYTEESTKTGSTKELLDTCKELLTDCLATIQSASDLTIGFLSNLREQIAINKNPLIYSMYYFVVFDYGLTRIMNILDEISTSEVIDQEDLLMIRSCISYIVPNSMELGKETKQLWEEAAEKFNPENWKEITLSLRKSKGNRGLKKSILGIDELLVGNKEELKTAIKLFLCQHPEPIALAYLLQALINAKKIKANLKYTTFHRAIEQFIGKKYGIDVPQKRFGELKIFSLDFPQSGKSFGKAKDVVGEWSTFFSNIS